MSEIHVPTAVLFPENFSWSASVAEFGTKKAAEGGAGNFIISRIAAIAEVGAAAIDALIHLSAALIKGVIWPFATVLWLVSGCSDKHDPAPGATLGAVFSHAARAVGYTVGIVAFPVIGLWNPESVWKLLNSTLAPGCIPPPPPPAPKEEPKAPETFKDKWKAADWTDRAKLVWTSGTAAATSGLAVVVSAGKTVVFHPYTAYTGTTSAIVLGLDHAVNWWRHVPVEVEVEGVKILTTYTTYSGDLARSIGAKANAGYESTKEWGLWAWSKIPYLGSQSK